MIFGGLTILLWFVIGVAEVPVVKLQSTWYSGPFTDNNLQCLGCTSNNDTLRYRVSPILFIISMMIFVGMFVFVFFGGIGMTSLPMDLMNAWKRRPKSISPQVYAQEKIKIATRCSQLIDKGNKLKEKFIGSNGRPKSRRDRKDYNQFRANVFLLDEDFTRLEKIYNKGIGPRIVSIMWAWTQLILGIFSVGITLLWILHMILYLVIVPPASPFLNQMFIVLDGVFSLFGTAMLGLFSFYLILCVVKGNFKFGVRVPFLFSIHPMKVGGTMMNSFLFNVLLILLSSLTIVHFCTLAFSLLTRFTAASEIFDIGVTNLVGIKYVYRFYFWFLIILPVLTLIYLAVFPSDKKVAGKGIYSTDLPK